MGEKREKGNKEGKEEKKSEEKERVVCLFVIEYENLDASPYTRKGQVFPNKTGGSAIVSSCSDRHEKGKGREKPSYATGV